MSDQETHYGRAVELPEGQAEFPCFTPGCHWRAAYFRRWRLGECCGTDYRCQKHVPADWLLTTGDQKA